MGRRVGVPGGERLGAAHRAGQRVVLAVRAPARGRHHPAHLAVRAGRGHPGREGLRGLVADQPLDAFAPPFAEGGADAVGRVARSPPRPAGAAWSPPRGPARPTPAPRHRPAGWSPRRLRRRSSRRRTPRPDGCAPPPANAARCSSSEPMSSSTSSAGALRRRSSSRFWSSPRVRLIVRLSRAVIGVSSSSRRAMIGSSGPGAASAPPAPAPRRRRRLVGLRRSRAARLRPRRPGRRARPPSAVVRRAAAAGAGGSVAGAGCSVSPEPARMRAKSSSTEGPAAVVSPASPGRAAHDRRRPRRRHLPGRLVRLVLVVGQLGRAEAELVGHALGGGPRLLVGPVELGQNPVDPVAHPVHRGGHLVPGRPQLLDLDPERRAAVRPGRPAPGAAPLGPGRGGRAPRPWRG